MSTENVQVKERKIVTPAEMAVVDKMKKGYWVTSTMGMGYMWHIEGSTLDHKVTDEEYKALQSLKEKGIVG